MSCLASWSVVVAVSAPALLFFSVLDLSDSHSYSAVLGSCDPFYTLYFALHAGIGCLVLHLHAGIACLALLAFDFTYPRCLL